jgi:hypothetical protein
MARNNYSFKKRQKEIKRQKKREEKLQRRLAKRGGDLEQASAENDPVDTSDLESTFAAGHQAVDVDVDVDEDGAAVTE